MNESKTAQNAGATSENQAEPETAKTFTQEEVNEMVGKARKKERSKYANFDEYKKAFEILKEREDADKSELQKANERAEMFEKQLKKLQNQNEIARIKAEISEKFNLPVSILRGDNEEEITEHAESMKKHFSQSDVPIVPSQGKQANARSKYRQFGEFINSSLK